LVTDSAASFEHQFRNTADAKKWAIEGSGKQVFAYVNDRSGSQIVIEESEEAKSDFVPPQKLYGPSEEKHVTLQRLESNVTDTQDFEAATIGVVLNVSGYCKTKSDDYVYTVQITDPTIFPAKAKLSVYTSDVSKLVKIAGVGDVILVTNAKWTKSHGKLCGIIGSK
jgi:hypothetical protein